MTGSGTRKLDASGCGFEVWTRKSLPGGPTWAADTQANAVDLPVVKPWPEPAEDFADVLHQALGRYERYLWLPPGAGVALTLWTAHADMYTAFHHTPRLILLSDEPGCGKATTFEVLASMVQKPLRSETMTPAVLFRVVDQHQPTLLLALVNPKSALRQRIFERSALLRPYIPYTAYSLSVRHHELQPLGLPKLIRIDL